MEGSSPTARIRARFSQVCIRNVRQKGCMNTGNNPRNLAREKPGLAMAGLFEDKTCFRYIKNRFFTISVNKIHFGKTARRAQIKNHIPLL
jgi:hypothetical protein